MVEYALLLSATAGIGLSAGLIYTEVGRYAAPQVPRSLFDERKLLIAYTAGLFVGIALSIPFGLFLTSLTGGSLFVGLIGLALLVVGMEAAQWVSQRSVYFGSDASRSFYALAVRAGASAILVLTLVDLFLGSASPDAYGAIAAVCQSAAVVGLQGAGALLAVRLPAPTSGASGGPVASGAFVAAGLFFLGFGSLFGPVIGAAVALLVLAMSIRSFRRLRSAVLGSVRPPATPGGAAAEPSSPFGRTDR